MLDWDTLRRLLGLPRDMPPPTASELARFAIDQPRHARRIGMVLRQMPPVEEPAAIVLGALDTGSVEFAIGLELLGCIQHRSGYRTAHAALHSAEVATEAGIAMARILGHAADADLVVGLNWGESRESREGAARGLAELGTGAQAISIAQAGRTGRIRARVTARCIARLPFDAAFWLELLGSEATSDRRLGSEVVYVLVRNGDPVARERLTSLGAAGKELIRASLAGDDLFMLPDKRTALARWVAEDD